MDLLLQEWADVMPLLECDTCPGGYTPHAQQQVLTSFNGTVEELLMECCRCGQHRTWISA